MSMVPALVDSSLRSDVENALNIKIKALYEGLSDEDKTYLTFFCTFDQKTYTYPGYDVFSAALLKITPAKCGTLAQDINLQRRILALRDIISGLWGQKVIREGLAFKQARINSLNEIASALDIVVAERKAVVLDAKTKIEDIKKILSNLLNGRVPESLDDNQKTEYDYLINCLANLEEIVVPGASSGLLDNKGDVDVALIKSKVQLQKQMADELGDIIKHSSSKSERQIKILPADIQELI